MSHLHWAVFLTGALINLNTCIIQIKTCNDYWMLSEVPHIFLQMALILWFGWLKYVSWSSELLSKIKSVRKQPIWTCYFKAIFICWLLKCIWQIFFICVIKSPQCTDKYNKRTYLIVIFLPPCFDVPKMWNFTSTGVRNREFKNRKLGILVTSSQDFKLHGKRVSTTFSYFQV